jgi:integrase
MLMAPPFQVKMEQKMEQRAEKLEQPKRLTDAALKALVSSSRAKPRLIFDGAVPGLSIRFGLAAGSAAWTLLLRVVGEGGKTATGRELLGKKHRVNLGSYPAISLQTVRATANTLLDQAKRGINPKVALAQTATAGGLTVRQFAEKFLKDYVHSRELDSAKKYELAFETHINPLVGDRLAELLTREEIRTVMDAARVKRKRPAGARGGMIGGVEAARTAMGVMRQMYSWGQEEGVIKRKDNPASKIQKNLPKKKQGEIVLNLDEARIVWRALEDCGYPFGTHAQLQLLTAERLDEWASAKEPEIDLKEALHVIPADNYKSDHVHVVPLVPQAVRILETLRKPTTGPYLLSSTRGSKPIKGVGKFFRTRLQAQIIANTGAKLVKRLTTQTLRRTVATRLAEALGDEGDKLVKRVLGHSDGSVTAIYNRYGYVREMRRVLEKWANELTFDAAPPEDASATRDARAVEQEAPTRPAPPERTLRRVPAAPLPLVVRHDPSVA